MKRIVFSHHKCLSTWLEQVCFTVAESRGESYGYFWDSLEADWLMVHNSNRSCFERLDGVEYRGIHVVRDPRDIVVSGYFSHRFSHFIGDWIELADHRQALESCSLSDGLLLEIEFLRRNFEELAAWDYGNQLVLELRAEDALCPDAGVAFWRRALPWLGSECEELPAIVERFSFRNVSGRERGTEDQRAFARKGIAGDWRNYFEPQHIEAMAEWAPLIEKLGYA